MNRKSKFISPMCGLLILAFCLPLNAADEKKNPVLLQMKASHVGTKAGPSPLGVVMEQLKGDKPKWEVIAKNNESLAVMAKMIEQAPEDTDLFHFSKESTYPKGVAELVDATADEDQEAARKALALVTTSCRECHAYGGCAGFLPRNLDAVVGKK